jgi:hypothetical protein
MSGRLIITTKKTYCPWNQQNVERVLRDERLERERIEKQAKAEKDAVIAKRRGEISGSAGVERHVNLFPEAEEAELRLARGGGSTTAEKINTTGGILPIPLGGEEASNRKSGRVPFYLQSHDDATFNANSYNERVLGRKVQGDAITEKIMMDQAVNREVSRKRKMDPMMRFYNSGECRDAPAAADATATPVVAPTAPANVVVAGNCAKTDQTSFNSGLENANTDKNTSSDQLEYSSKKKRYTSSKKSHRKPKRTKRTNSGHKSSSDSSTASSTSHRRHSKKRHERKKKSHHKDSKNRRDHHSSSRKRCDKIVNTATTNDSSQTNDNELQLLRKKRLEREARENQRVQNMMGEDNTCNTLFVNDRDRGYQDQWNPMLSRK